MKTKTKAKTQAGEPARGARSALPVGRFTRCVFAFVFVLIYVYFELIMKVIDDDDDDFDDDERKKSKKTNFSSNDRSGHDDQNAYWIIKNGAILEG